MSDLQSKPRDFWSRRRAAVAAEAVTEEAIETARIAEAEEAQLAERSDEEILSELDLPEPEALESPDQVRAFLNAEVPQRLKTRALRRLWRLNPVLANVDGLVDYGEDFTDAAMIVENMQTVYQVGKGMLTALVEEDTEEEGTAKDASPVADAETPIEEAEQPLVAEAEPEPLPDPELLPEPVPSPVAMPQRRMRFAYDTA